MRPCNSHLSTETNFKIFKCFLCLRDSSLSHCFHTGTKWSNFLERKSYLYQFSNENISSGWNNKHFFVCFFLKMYGYNSSEAELSNSCRNDWLSYRIFSSILQLIIQNQQTTYSYLKYSPSIICVHFNLWPYCNVSIRHTSTIEIPWPERIYYPQT